MKTTDKKSDTIRYLIFAFTFLVVLTLIFGLIFMIDKYSEKLSEKNITNVVEKEQYVPSKNEFDFDVEDIEPVPENLSGNEIEK